MQKSTLYLATVAISLAVAYVTLAAALHAPLVVNKIPGARTFSRRDGRKLS